jgi:phenylpropionate dioxygenase-like ring-hydroxylating dioxygenase large terminal subunit
VHPVDSLPDDRPWSVKVLGRDLVVWKDGNGEWRVFDDACPHRKVALSEGRLEADGTLSCAYHGWRFDGAVSIHCLLMQVARCQHSLRVLSVCCFWKEAIA